MHEQEPDELLTNGTEQHPQLPQDVFEESIARFPWMLFALANYGYTEVGMKQFLDIFQGEYSSAQGGIFDYIDWEWWMPVLENLYKAAAIVEIASTYSQLKAYILKDARATLEQLSESEGCKICHEERNDLALRVIRAFALLISLIWSQFSSGPLGLKVLGATFVFSSFVISVYSLIKIAIHSKRLSDPQVRSKELKAILRLTLTGVFHASIAASSVFVIRDAGQALLVLKFAKTIEEQFELLRPALALVPDAFLASRVYFYIILPVGAALILSKLLFSMSKEAWAINSKNWFTLKISSIQKAS